ncbi:hypothetical protein DMN91_001480 [Ooceraea biroi]|uniref:Uncharacterized protein n=1 Tax=Ooceraea biroi TaxID=2015173 RepID=A0A3L8DXZ0_OOCBI|nr:hypothetical protein DMN91_001480 [Ooceraea biroi]
MRRASLRAAPGMRPLLSCWCVIATLTLALAAWQENVRPKMYVQLAQGLKALPQSSKPHSLSARALHTALLRYDGAGLQHEWQGHAPSPTCAGGFSLEPRKSCFITNR